MSPVPTPLVQRPLTDLLEAFSARTPTPGGGSASALAGALGASLGVMAARFTEALATDPDVARLEQCRGRFVKLVDSDAAAYDGVKVARALPRGTDEEKSRRRKAVEEATLAAAEEPLKGIRDAVEALEILKGWSGRINPNLSSDVGVATHLLSAALEGCALNVAVNVDGLKGSSRAGDLGRSAGELQRQGREIVAKIRSSA